ncbi:hypothetical protein [Actinophytocola sp.]|uniref:hypothetical protein n=1 Tax=Actinophytocola sp. TaxID=1872138 RepID=UPI003D6ADF53
MKHLLRDVTKVRPATSTDAYNNTSYDYGVAATRTVTKAWIQQASAAEPVTDGRAPLIGRWLLISDDLDWKGRDRVEDGPTVYEVDGPPWVVHRGGSGPHHLEANLQTVTG